LRLRRSVDLNEVELGDFDIDDAAVFMNDVATNNEMEVQHIAGTLSTSSENVVISAVQRNA
jgi:hypothetical protein